MRICCITGNRPQGFPWNYKNTDCKFHQAYLESLACQIETLIRKDGCTHFISGGAIGVDMDFADIVIGLRNKYYPKITLEIAISCVNQNKKLTIEDTNLYIKIIDSSDKISIISNIYSNDCMKKRNEYMVDKSDIVLAYWHGKRNGGTYNTIMYAKKLSKLLYITYLYSFILS